MDIDKKFNEVISMLQDGKRPQIKLSESELLALNNKWIQVIKTGSWSQLFSVLCILDNTLCLSPIFNEQIYKSLRECNDSETTVLILGIARKHTIEEHHKRSHRVPFEFITILKELILSKDPQVLEWCLRLIESLGSQSIILKEDVLKNKPGIGAIFNQHKKASKQIIELLEKRWNPPALR